MELARTIPAAAEVEDRPELTRLQYLLFDLLREYRGSVVRYHVIAARLWPGKPELEAGPPKINVLARRTSAALKGGEKIEAVRGRGLRLVSKPAVDNGAQGK